jgi:hypothetical protein
MSDQHATVLVAAVLDALASADDLELSGVFMIVNSNVEKLTQLLMSAEAEGRFDEASDLASDIGEVYQAAAKQVPPDQQGILESIDQYWEGKAGAAQLRAASSAVDRQLAAQPQVTPASSTTQIARSVGAAGSAQKQIDKRHIRTDEPLGAARKPVRKAQGTDSGTGGTKT